MWTICHECQGQGKINRGLSKKAQRLYKTELAAYENKQSNIAPIRPKAHLHLCTNCSGSGLMQSEKYLEPDLTKPHVAIIGAGIGGVALAVACLHRGIPFTIYERDSDFDARSQGYGLTLQQASKAMKGLGITSLDGVISTKHIVHNTEGKILGEWGTRKWLETAIKSPTKRTNIHIARQLLRLALLEQLEGNNAVQWGHQLVNLRESEDGVELDFQTNENIKTVKADLVVGADGIRSAVRRLIIGEETTPLRYLDCIVILGICPLSALEGLSNDLLDGETIFQTANGNERIYVMPYTADSVMWQLSFPMSEEEAKELSSKGPQALKEEACRRTQWHTPIPQILQATQENLISGYPVYDRELLSSALLEKNQNITLIGDAAHPMSPFKGQGANQALLDALKLARKISKGCNAKSKWKEKGLRESVLNEFETEMLERSAAKVQGSADAAQFLHSEIILQEGDEPRGRCLKRKKDER
ncbi:FAD-dependent oxidoreductase [Flavobacterium nitrogenifigens]|uniref:2-polyprenyl-6-methoxyphenol hydroxylase n=1 Tax=Flavobacterium nitrogenifigens TaxID=1617283 RepID=A0A521BGB1_9FLAO|nr:NAD(P)/FAD-dependent oxidoreductase [Flavobacterium nitrogenifigens]KAF2339020.1 FAD-dependent monooxygenase [Flavobacterium nitrogenifigens]SMO46136.1 2-polyprenyl-6-methoxyphenol hydroxylase [Flavobacterium nitrogenifigens]